MTDKDEIHKTGVFLTEEEIKSVKEAKALPYIIVGGYAPPSPAEIIHKLALFHGLPDIQGYYGALATGEITCLKSSLGTEPDEFPSRKLSDIVEGKNQGE